MFVNSRALDSFDQYLFDVEKYPLIEEAGEERELARRARAGDKEAAERLVTANLRFVISYVKKYQGRGLGLAELVCIGNEGLLKAVKKFDPDKGVKFISYAVWWIRQTVLQALAEQTRSVRIPLNQNSNLVKLSRTETALTQLLGRTPTDQEIADEMGEPVDTVRALRRVAASELSLDAPIDRGDRDSASFGERFAGAEAEDIEESVESQAQREFLDRMFEKYLTERERKILYRTTVWTTARSARSRRSARCWVSRASGSARSGTAPSRSSARAPMVKHSKRSGARTERQQDRVTGEGSRSAALLFFWRPPHPP
jgi:RNA polymerase primary sigma factor